MGSYRAVAALMTAVESLLKRDFPEELAGGAVSGRVEWLGSHDLATRTDFGSLLGLYLHRVTADSAGHNRMRPAEPGSGRAAAFELPVDLHFLLVSWSSSPASEAALHAYGMRQLAAHPQLDISDVVSADSHWRPHDRAQIAPSDLGTEDLFRIWDTLPTKYTLTSSYVLRTARIELDPPSAHGVVKTRVFTAERHPEDDA